MENKLKIPLSRPDITEKEIQAVLSVLKTPNLSLGPKLTEFEEKFAEYIGTKYAIAVNSGTSGLHLAVKSLGIGEDDAVITTPFSFIASANCILYEKALPIFVDIEPRTYNIDPQKIDKYIRDNCIRHGVTGNIIDRRTGKRIKAILPVHIFGHPCDMSKIIELAHKYNLYIIEDACEALGAEYYSERQEVKGERARSSKLKPQTSKVGTFGDLGVFAFYPNKQITTGEGGMIVTNDENIALLCKSLRNQGRDMNGGWLAHSKLGYNYRISDINCALGIAQLERIGEILNSRERVALTYNEVLRGSVKCPETLDGNKRSWFVYVACLPEQFSKKERDDVLAQLCDLGIACNNYFPPIHMQPFYRKMFGYTEGDFEITEAISERTIALPFHNNLKQHEILYVVDNLRSILQLIGS